MILTAHQPVYLPWLGLFHKIALAEEFVSFNQVQYLPKDWNNRNRIKTAEGPIWLTVPVLSSGHREKTLSEIEINNNLPWQRKHWKSLSLNYSKTPFFNKYAGFFEEVYLKKDWKYLCDLNDFMLKWFLDILGIKTVFRDARNFSFQGEKSQLVLDMCLQLGATQYIFGTLGKNYADIEAFRINGVEPVFQEYSHPSYSQLHGLFQPNLSVVDLLFNCGPDSFDIIMADNQSPEDLLNDSSI